MKRYLGALAGLALLAGGCSGGNPAGDGGLDSGIVDLLTPTDGPGAGAIGSTCKAASDCNAGTTPTCFSKYFNNKTGNVQTRGGYCSSPCTADADCGGAGATCVDFGSDGKFCIAGCMAATDCRQFYACFNFGCFPSDNLTCDSTMNNGTCTYLGRPGGCVRQALGTGNKGECFEGCAVGVDTCAPDGNGNVRHCIVDDERTNTNPDMTSSNDKWVGPVCLFADSTITPIADGTECKFTQPDGTIAHFTDICVDGDECYIQGTAAAGHGFDANGDNLCHKLCYLGNMTPSVPDAGFDFADGGALAGPCSSGQTCTDIWGLAATAEPVGLCK
jgi:hypothetical protein